MIAFKAASKTEVDAAHAAGEAVDRGHTGLGFQRDETGNRKGGEDTENGDHDHQLDQAAIEWALARGFGFIGGVGSRAKAARTRARLEARSVPEPDIARVRMPIGVDIGARTPGEIAVSIAAELIAWRKDLHRR